jgi:hypothetical protein
MRSWTNDSDCGTMRPAPRLRWPTSLLPIWPAGRPTAGPEAASEVRGPAAQSRSKTGVWARATALPGPLSARPKPSRTTSSTGRVMAGGPPGARPDAAEGAQGARVDAVAGGSTSSRSGTAARSTPRCRATAQRTATSRAAARRGSASARGSRSAIRAWARASARARATSRSSSVSAGVGVPGVERRGVRRRCEPWGGRPAGGRSRSGGWPRDPCGFPVPSPARSGCRRCCRGASPPRGGGRAARSARARPRRPRRPGRPGAVPGRA